MGFAAQAAAGMSYIHSKTVVHRDVAARNVLLSADTECMVTDFGLARDVHYTDEIYCVDMAKGHAVPYRWTSLEGLTNRIFTIESDVWSFAVLLSEICSRGEAPYADHLGGYSSDFVSKLKSGERMARKHTWSPFLYAVMERCWVANIARRPAFATLADELEAERARLLSTPTPRYENRAPRQAGAAGGRAAGAGFAAPLRGGAAVPAASGYSDYAAPAADTVLHETVRGPRAQQQPQHPSDAGYDMPDLPVGGPAPRRQSSGDTRNTPVAQHASDPGYDMPDLPAGPGSARQTSAPAQLEAEAPAPAPAAAVRAANKCTYTSSAGKPCNNRRVPCGAGAGAAPPAAYCRSHTCPAGGCTAPKRSQDGACPRHAATQAEGTQRGGGAPAATKGRIQRDHRKPSVYAPRAVQFHPNGGQFGFVWLPARTPHGACVWCLAA